MEDKIDILWNAERELNANKFFKDSVDMMIENLRSRLKIALDGRDDQSDALQDYLLIDNTIDQLILLRDGYCNKAINKSKQNFDSIKSQMDQEKSN